MDAIIVFAQSFCNYFFLHSLLVVASITTPSFLVFLRIHFVSFSGSWDRVVYLLGQIHPPRHPAISVCNSLTRIDYVYTISPSILMGIYCLSAAGMTDDTYRSRRCGRSSPVDYVEELQQQTANSSLCRHIESTHFAFDRITSSKCTFQRKPDVCFEYRSQMDASDIAGFLENRLLL